MEKSWVSKKLMTNLNLQVVHFLPEEVWFNFILIILAPSPPFIPESATGARHGLLIAQQYIWWNFFWYWFFASYFSIVSILEGNVFQLRSEDFKYVISKLVFILYDNTVDGQYNFNYISSSYILQTVLRKIKKNILTPKKAYTQQVEMQIEKI